LSADFEFVQITDDFIAKDFEHLLNIFYTMLDSGQEEFIFYCAYSYRECSKDVFAKVLNRDGGNYMGYINHFVHPFNSYSAINVTANNFGRVTVKITKQYSEEQIEFVLAEIESITESIITDNMSIKDKIEEFHDYIIYLADYDEERADNMDDPKFKDSFTHTAYGLFKDNLALCGGFSDAMAIFLHQIGVRNYLISGVDHVWNLVEIDNKWLHIDVTWNNPLTDRGTTFILHYWFLIDTPTLMALSEEERHERTRDSHRFNKNIFLEAI